MLGTPTEEQWPGVSGLRDWHEFPQWKPQSLARAVPTLEPEGIDLLSVSSLYLEPEFDPFLFSHLKRVCIFSFGDPVCNIVT